MTAPPIRAAARSLRWRRTAWPRAARRAARAAVASRIASTGNVSADGSPPAIEVMPGRSVILRRSRMTEGFMRAARRARVKGEAVVVDGIRPHDHTRGAHRTSWYHPATHVRELARHSAAGARLLRGLSVRADVAVAQERMVPALGLTMASMGAITAWGFQLPYTLFQVPGGMFGERFGVRAALALTLLGVQRFVLHHRLAAGGRRGGGDADRHARAARDPQAAVFPVAAMAVMTTCRWASGCAPPPFTSPCRRSGPPPRRS